MLFCCAKLTLFEKWSMGPVVPNWMCCRWYCQMEEEWTYVQAQYVTIFPLYDHSRYSAYPCSHFDDMHKYCLCSEEEWPTYIFSAQTANFSRQTKYFLPSTNYSRNLTPEEPYFLVLWQKYIVNEKTLYEKFIYIFFWRLSRSLINFCVQKY